MQLPDGRLLPRKAQHLRVCRSWCRFSQVQPVYVVVGMPLEGGTSPGNHQTKLALLEPLDGRINFNSEHFQLIRFCSRVHVEQGNAHEHQFANELRWGPWEYPPPNSATLHNEQLVWGITASKIKFSQLSLSGVIVEKTNFLS